MPSWNCLRGADVSHGLSLLSPLRSDLITLQECRRLAIDSASVIWRGTDPRQGVAVVGHVSLDLAHANSVGWRAAQEADGVFISDYARDFPDRADIAESILPYFAVRYWPERLSEADRAAILAAIPNRLAYFDEQGFDMSPYRAMGSTTRVLGLRPFQPRRIWRPREGPPSR